MSGKEFNKHFAMENRFAGSLQSLVLSEIFESRADLTS
jgi:hypothetical protein